MIKKKKKKEEIWLVNKYQGQFFFFFPLVLHGVCGILSYH